MQSFLLLLQERRSISIYAAAPSSPSAKARGEFSASLLLALLPSCHAFYLFGVDLRDFHEVPAVPFGGPVAAIRDDCKIVQLYSESQCSLSLHLDILFAMAEVVAASFEALDRHRDCQSENPHGRLTSSLYPPPPPRKRLHKCRSHISIAYSSCSNRTSKSNFSWGIDGAIQGWFKVRR